MTRGQVYAGKAVILIEALDKVDQTLRTVENKFKRLGNNLGAMGRTAFTGGFFASIAQGSLLARFAKFDDMMLTLRVKMGLLTDVTEEQERGFAKLEKRIRDLGKSTSFTSQEVADGAIRLAQAGFNNKEIEDSLQSVLDLARGTGVDLANAATTLANAMRTYNLETETANQVVSMFVRATRMGTVEIDDLAQSLKYASATAVNLGQSLPDVLAIFTLLSDKGMRGSISGTSLNTALQQIAKKAEDISASSGLGFQVPVDAKGNLLFSEFLKNLQMATATMSKMEKSKVFGDIFNLRGNRSILPIANEEDIKRLLSLSNAIASAQDEARQAAEIMDSGFGGAIRRAVSAVDDLNISLQSLTSGPLVSFMGIIPPIATALDKLITKYQGFTLLLAASPGIALAAGAGMMLLGRALKIVGSLSGVMRGIGGSAVGLAGKTMIGSGVKAAGKMKMPKMDFLGKFPKGAASAVSSSYMKTYNNKSLANAGVATSRGTAGVQSFARNKATDTVGVGKFLGKKSIDALKKEEEILGQKLQKAAKSGNNKAAAKYGVARKKVQDDLARAVTGRKQLPFIPLNALGNKNTKELPFLSGATLSGATDAKSGPKQSALGRVKTKRSPIKPQLLGMLGKAGGMAKNIAGIAGGFLKAASAVGKFVFSLNGVMLLFTFGDRIPVIKDALANLSNAFSAAFGQIGNTIKALGPAIDFFSASFALLGNKKTQDLGFEGILSSLGLMVDIVKNQLLAAWQAFKMELGWVWDTAKMLVGTMWELGKAVLSIATNSIGNLIGNTLDMVTGRISQVFEMFKSLTGGEGSAGGMAQAVLKGIATIVAELFNWVGYAVIKLNNMLFGFIEELELALLRVVGQMLRISPFATDTTGEAIEMVNRRKNTRKVQERRDLMSNEGTMESFQQALGEIFSSDAAKEGALGLQRANEAAKAAGQEATRQMQRMRQIAGGLLNGQASSPATPGTMSPGSPMMVQQQQQLQQLRADLRGFAAALTGSAAGTRGNVTRAVTESELKKQTEILMDIRDETRLNNERSGNVFRR